MFNYKDYWNSRYINGGNSGAGSYDENAYFKADFINNFIKENNIETTIEFGCGDGNNLALYECKEYLGLDVSEKAIELCRDMFKSDNSKRFELLDNRKKYLSDLTLALDVTYHIFGKKEWEQFINKVINSATRFAIFYSFAHPKGNCKHINNYNFEEYIQQLCINKGYGYNKLDIVPPNSNSRFYIIQKC